MKYLSIIISSLVMATNIYSQTTKKIEYFLPDSVEVKIQNDVFVKKELKKYYIYIKNESKDTFRLYVVNYDLSSSKMLNKIIKATTRFAIIKEKQIPILFDYDYVFCNFNMASSGEYGKRGQVISRAIPFIDSYSIKFTDVYILDDENNVIGFANYTSKEE